MTKEFEDKGNNYSIRENVNIGEVRVADEVVAIIAGLAATEVEGVESMAGNITNELVAKLGMKNLSRHHLYPQQRGRCSRQSAQ